MGGVALPRQDNALKRLGPLAAELGMLTAEEIAVLDNKVRREEEVIRAARSLRLAPDEVNPYLDGLGESQVTDRQRISELVKRPAVRLNELFQCRGRAAEELDEEAVLSAQIELKYQGYLARERDAARKLAELASFRLPTEMTYADLASLSTEARQKLDRVKPESLAQASRIPGVSPSDLQNLVLEVMKRRQAA